MERATENAVGTPRHPFDLFPEEIWEMILDDITEAKHVLSVFNAIPQLRNKELWTKRIYSKLIDQLIPLLMPKYLNLSTVLQSRLVSRHWKKAVDMCLESHPDRLPYQHSSSTGKGTSLGPTAYFNYQGLPKFRTGQDLVSSANLRKEIMSLSRQGNPFLGRCLTLAVSSPPGGEELLSYPENERRNLLEGWASDGEQLRISLPVLEKFGRHIWYVEFDLSGHNYNNVVTVTRDTITVLFECLAHLPNLSSLRLEGSLPSSLYLSFLNVLRIWGCGCNCPRRFDLRARLSSLDVADLLVRCSHLQYRLFKELIEPQSTLRKLAIDVTAWDFRLEPHLSNLSDLHLKSCRSTKLEPFLHRTKVILSSLKQALRKLRITILDLNISQLLGILAAYNIQTLQLDVPIGSNFASVQRFREDEPTSASLLVPSIQQLVLDDSLGLSYNFLNQLPSLESLSVGTHNSWWRNSSFWKSSKAASPTYAFGIHLRTYLYHNSISHSDVTIWDKLPRLNILTAHDNGNIFRRYVREYGNRMFTC